MRALAPQKRGKLCGRKEHFQVNQRWEFFFFLFEKGIRREKKIKSTPIWYKRKKIGIKWTQKQLEASSLFVIKNKMNFYTRLEKNRLDEEREEFI